MPESLAIAVRPTRPEIAAARLVLLLHGREGRWSIGLMTFLIGVGLSVGGPSCAGGIAALALAFVTGGAVLLVHSAGGGDRLSRNELEGGVLLQLGPQGLAATVCGATTYYDWEHVALREVTGGIAFLLPRRTFHLLPYSALVGEELLRLRALLADVRGRQSTFPRLLSDTATSGWSGPSVPSRNRSASL